MVDSRKLSEYYSQGFWLDEVEEYEQVLDSMLEQLRSDPSNSCLLNNCGVASIEIGRDAEAESYLERALAAESDEGVIHINYAKLLKDKGRLDQALAAIERAITLMPEDPLPRCQRADWYMDEGRFDLAIRDLDRAIDLKPDWRWYYLKRAECYRRTGRDREAQADEDMADSLPKPASDSVVMESGAIINSDYLEQQRALAREHSWTPFNDPALGHCMICGVSVAGVDACYKSAELRMCVTCFDGCFQ